MNYQALYEDLAARNMGHIQRGEVSRLFGVDGDYTIWHLPTKMRTYPQAARMLNDLGYTHFNACADLGCGTVTFRDHFDIKKAYLFDIAYQYCRYMKAVQADVHALPLPDKSVNLVVCSDVLEHVEHLEEVLSEITRVLDGVLLVSVPVDDKTNEYHLRTFNPADLGCFAEFDVLAVEMTQPRKKWLDEAIIVMRTK